MGQKKFHGEGAASDYIPSKLPCGRKVNEDWKPGDKIQCCKSECPTLTGIQIQRCYNHYQKQSKLAELDRFGEELPDVSGKHRLFYH